MLHESGKPFNKTLDKQTALYKITGISGVSAKQGAPQ
jgi:hypothetical protein